MIITRVIGARSFTVCHVQSLKWKGIELARGMNAVDTNGIAKNALLTVILEPSDATSVTMRGNISVKIALDQTCVNARENATNQFVMAVFAVWHVEMMCVCVVAVFIIVKCAVCVRKQVYSTSLPGDSFSVMIVLMQKYSGQKFNCKCLKW